MQTTTLRFALGAVAAMVALVTAHPRPAQANPGNGAVIIREDGACTIGGGLIGYPDVIVADVKAVDNVAGGTNFRCDGQIPAGFEPQHAVSAKVDCSSPNGPGEGHLVFSPSGNVSLTCHIEH